MAVIFSAVKFTFFKITSIILKRILEDFLYDIYHFSILIYVISPIYCAFYMRVVILKLKTIIDFLSVVIAFFVLKKEWWFNI